MKRSYLRDGRAPLPYSKSTSKVMSANRAKNTQPELILRKALSREGISGYRLNWKKAPGRPDIAFPARRIAIFINGCFWHSCPYCHPSLPRSHTGFWKRKFENNRRRDKEKTTQLRREGWKVLTIWECRLKKDPRRAINRVRQVLETIEVRSE